MRPFYIKRAYGIRYPTPFSLPVDAIKTKISCASPNKYSDCTKSVEIPLPFFENPMTQKRPKSTVGGVYTTLMIQYITNVKHTDRRII